MPAFKIRLLLLAITNLSPVASLGESGNAIEAKKSSHLEVTEDQDPMKIKNQKPSEHDVDMDGKERDVQEIQRASFDTVPFKEQPFNFDYKYTLEGRYSFDLEGLTSPIDPRGPSFHDNQALPQTGIVQANESPSENDAMTGQLE